MVEDHSWTILDNALSTPSPLASREMVLLPPGPASESSQILTVTPDTFRGLFIIDGKGVLRQITVNDLPVGRSVDEALRLVQAFQYTDEHGEGEWTHIYICSHVSRYAGPLCHSCGH